MKYQVCVIKEGVLRHFYRKPDGKERFSRIKATTFNIYEEAVDIMRQYPDSFIQSEYDCHFRQTDSDQRKQEHKEKTLRDLLPFVAYGAALDIVRVENGMVVHLFPECDLVTREMLQKFRPDLLDCQLKNGIHAEGIRNGTICIEIR